MKLALPIETYGQPPVELRDPGCAAPTGHENSQRERLLPNIPPLALAAAFIVLAAAQAQAGGVPGGVIWGHRRAAPTAPGGLA